MDHTKIAVEIFNNHAVGYQDKFMDVSIYHDSLDFFCKSLIKVNAEILEVACGPGNITKFLLEKRYDFNILGTDLAPNMIALASKNNPTAHFELMDCREISTLNKKFDGIVCGFGLPYLSKTEAIQFIESASVKLNTNGIIYISTMEDNYSNSGYQTGSTGDKIYQNFHQADYLTHSLEFNHFRIIYFERKKYLHNDKETTDLILIATKSNNE